MISSTPRKHRNNLPVALTNMGKPLFKALDGGYYEIVWVTEDSTMSGLQQGHEPSVLVEQKVRPKAIPSGLPMSVRSKIYAISGITLCDSRLRIVEFERLEPLSTSTGGSLIQKSLFTDPLSLEPLISPYLRRAA